jgi:hypothetical protein
MPRGVGYIMWWKYCFFGCISIGKQYFSILKKYFILQNINQSKNIYDI